MEHIDRIIDKLGTYPISGLCSASLSGLFFTISNFMVQIAIQLNTRASIPVHQIVFARSVIQLIFLVPIILIFKLDIAVGRKDFLSLFSVSLTGFLNIVFIYMALEKIPISDALVISFTSPIFTAILAFFVLREKCEWLDAVCGFVSFFGVIVVARPTFIFGNKTHKQVLFREGMTKEKQEIIYLIGAGYALIGGVSIAIYLVFIRKFAMRSQNMVNLFYPSIAGTVITPWLMYVFGEQFVKPQSYHVAFSIISVGTCSCIGLGFLTLSLMLEHATNVALVRNLDVIYAYVLQYCAMGIAPSLWSIVGGLIIIFATSVMAINRQTRNTCNADSEDGMEGEELEVDGPTRSKENG